MSYCRWSSDNWKSDVYCYRNGKSIVTQVASSRIKIAPPQLPDRSEVSPEEFQEACKEHLDFISDCKLEDIKLPYDGQTFKDSDERNLLARLKTLRSIGYYVPEYVIEDLEKGEINDT